MSVGTVSNCSWGYDDLSSLVVLKVIWKFPEIFENSREYAKNSSTSFENSREYSESCWKHSKIPVDLVENNFWKHIYPTLAPM